MAYTAIPPVSSGGGGGAPTTATYITQTADATLSAEQAMGSLATGLVKNTTTTGVQSIASGVQDFDTLALINTTVAPFMAARDAALVKLAFYCTGADMHGKLERGTATNAGDAYMVAGTGSDWKARMESGATASGAMPVRMRTRGVSGATGLFDVCVANCRTSKWGIWARCIVNAVTATSQLSICNMTDEATAETYLGVLGATSTTNFVSKIGSGAAQDTGVAIGVLGTAQHDLYWICDGTNVKAYLDGSTSAATTGASNTGANAAGHWQTNPQNGATAANAGFDLIAMAVFIA